MHYFPGNLSKGLAVLAFTLLIAQSIAQTERPSDPRDYIIYQIFIDRFENGDPSNDDGNPRAGFDPSSPWGFHGGDIEGIRQRLPYVKELGANAIWITPFVENVNDYHGYGAFDWYNVDPNFGTIQELRDMVSEAHDQGIAVFFDMVAGHMGNLIDSRTAGYPGYLAPPNQYNLRWRYGLQYPPPFDSLQYFHAHGHIGSFVAPEQELGELSGLDDLKTDTDYVRENMLDIWNFWSEETNVDGYRVDTVKHVDLEFWEYFFPPLRQAARDDNGRELFIFGEIYGADDNYMRQYVGTLFRPPYKLDSALDFQFYYVSDGVFARATSPSAYMGYRLEARQFNLPGHHLMMPNFIDNHDVRRFLNVAEDNPGSGKAEQLRRLELALTCLYTAPGPPVVYYGTEQGFDGGGDPYNREDMFDGLFETGPSVGDNFDTGSSLFQYLKRLGQLRRELAPLRRGEIFTEHGNENGPGILAYRRAYDGEDVYVILNTATVPRTVPSTAIPGFASSQVADALNPLQQLAIDETGSFPSREIPSQGAEIWVLADQLPPPAPGIASFVPADGELGVPIDTEFVTIGFLTPMNRQSVEAAVSVTPAISYTPSWDQTSQVLTLALGEQLQPRIEYTVTVAASAESAEGATLDYNASATWLSGRVEEPPPPLPAPYGPLAPIDFAISTDGTPAEWPVATDQQVNSGTITNANTFRWLDSEDDDTGPGAYQYPSNSVFTGEDADIVEFQFAYDDEFLYILYIPKGINPGASFYVTYLGVAIDTAEGGPSLGLGYDQSTGAPGITELHVRDDSYPEYEVVFTGPEGATIVDRSGGFGTAIPSGFEQQTGVVEIAVPRAELGLDGVLSGRQLRLIVYTALETFGGIREISPNRSEWEPGGGISETTDPDVFDLIGADAAGQAADLANFDGAFATEVQRSVIPLLLSEVEPRQSTIWMLH